ncbi:MAG: glutamate racemase [Akkermansiaceae bacterium]|jgi:glutamate racemase
MLDSGVGGLSVLREIHALLPRHSIHYVGDTAWCPYGTKSFEEIIARTSRLSDELISRGAEVIVLACNSATIAAIESLRAEYPIPFIGMEPGVKPAAALTQTNIIGVLATEVSLRGDKFHRLVSTHAHDLRVITQPCPRFVELVEAGILDGPDVESAIDEYAQPLVEAGADVLILGCSHYPFLKPALKKALPRHVRFVDTGDAIARRVQSHALPEDTNSTIQIQTTGNPGAFNRLIPLLAPHLPATCTQLTLS